MRQDFRFALRTLRVHPWFSVAVAAVLALGIGANTAVFTLVNAVLFKPLPFRGGDRLVAIFHKNGTRANIAISYPDYLEYRAQTSAFESLEASSTVFLSLSESGNPSEVYQAARVTPGLLAMLGVQPIRGRLFGPADASRGAASVVLISHDVWRDRYDLAGDVVGKPVRIGDQLATITGVMPEGFGFPGTYRLWVPLVDGPEINQRSQRNLMLVGVRKAGVSMDQARADLNLIAHRLAAEYAADDKGIEATVQTFHELQNGGPIRIVFLMMQGAVFFVLLVACANVANMMLSRALGRTRELSVRAAIGASRWRILRQMLVEAVVLGAAGGAAGLVLARYAVRAFAMAVADVGKPSWIVFEMNYAVFAYFAAMCLLTSVLFGIVPALQASRVNLQTALKEGARDSGSRGRGMLSGTLVVVQFTLALVLLVGAGMFVRGLVQQRANMEALPAGEVLTAFVQLPQDRYPDDESRFRFFDRLLASLRGTPGLRQAEVASAPPGGGAAQLEYQVEGALPAEPGHRPVLLRVATSPGYLSAIDVPLLAGRAFDDRDGLPGHDSVIVTREFASRVWPGTSVLGKRLRVYPEAPPGGQPPTAGDTQPATPGPWLTVVGVSGDLDQRPTEANSPPLLFVPFASGGYGAMSVMLRATGDPLALAGALRAAVQRLDPDRALAGVVTLAERMEQQRWYLRVFGTAFLIFAAGALLMASIGIYAVVAQATARRTQEIGIRLALGATSRNIHALVVGRGLLQLGVGLVLGLAAAFAVTRQMGSMVNVSPTDPVVFGTVIGLVGLVGLVACWLPGRRATHLPPIDVLRGE